MGPRAKAIAEAAAYRTEGSSSKGASGETETASTGAHVKAGWKKAESNEDNRGGMWSGSRRTHI